MSLSLSLQLIRGSLHMQESTKRDLVQLAGLILLFGLFCYLFDADQFLFWDTDTIEFGLAIHCFIAFPITLAANFIPIWFQEDKASRLKASSDWKGMRVKQRLLWLSILGSWIPLTAFVFGFMGALWANASIGALVNNRVLASATWCVLPILCQYLGTGLFTFACMKWNWMTWDEAKVFFIKPYRGWPESWLEPAEEKSEQVL